MLLCVLSSLQRELVAFTLFVNLVSCDCYCSSVSWVPLQCVIVVFPDHTCLLSQDTQCLYDFVEVEAKTDLVQTANEMTKM